jgi:uncharacterized membrane protein YphA (DoxX/SURF4 family)
MKNLIRTFAPPSLILLFVYAGVSKWLTFEEFRGQLHNQTFPGWIADILAYTLIPLELLAAVLLSFAATQKSGLRLAAALLLAFTGYIALVLLHVWGRVPCSCGGVLKNMSWRVHLVFNFAFLMLSFCALFLPQRRKEPVS